MNTPLAHGAWVQEKPLRMQMMRALIETAFTGPGRDFPTILTAIMINEKIDRSFIDHDSLAANLSVAHKRGLLKRSMKKNGKTYFKKGEFMESRSNFWRITNDGIAAYRLADELA